MATLTDSFGQADENPLSSSGVWSTYSGLTNLQVVGNRVRPSATGGTDALQTHTGSVGNDQYARVTLPALTGAGNKDVGVCLRFAAPNTHTGYEFYCSNTGAIRSGIAEITAGSFANLSTDAVTNWTANDELIGVAQGSQLNLFRLSGATLTLLVNTTDTTLTSGRVGIVNWVGTGAVSDAEVDNFEASEIPITRVAAGTFASGSGTTQTVTIPGGGAAGDLALLFIVGRPTGTVEITSVSNGFTQVPSATSLQEAGTNDLRIQVFSKILVGGDSNPVITVPASWQGTTAGVGATIGIWRGVDQTSPFDVTSVASVGASADTFQPTGATPTAAWAMLISFVGTSDDNALSLGASPAVPRGFNPLMSGASYHAATNVGDFAIGVAEMSLPVASTPTMPTWDQTLVGPDPWAGITLVLRPAAAQVVIPTVHRAPYRPFPRQT